MQVINELQDLTYLQWSKIKHSSGTAGSFLKAYSDFYGKKVYYKLSNYDAVKGIVGHECVNEIIVDRLLRVLGVEHLSYTLIHAKIMLEDQVLETYLCSSPDFKQLGESKLALDTYYQLEREKGESLLEFCRRNGWEDYLYTMLVVDFLILNRDRHGANVEVLRNRPQQTLRLAPLFDHGLSLMFSCYNEDQWVAYDVMADKPVQCCVGSHSARDNLSLIPKDKLPELKPLLEEHKEFLLKDLEQAMPAEHLEKIWSMLWNRWCYYEAFCHSRQ